MKGGTPWWTFLAKTLHSMQRAQAQSQPLELGPACHNKDPVQAYQY